MNESEISRRLRIAAAEIGVPVERIRPIPKSELVEGETYRGTCRNAANAVWKGNHFEYQRYKFGSWFTDTINHFEDDDGCDLFVPVKVID